MNETIKEHLSQALNHLHQALQMSVQTVLADKRQQSAVGQLWEQFLGQFFNSIRRESKQSKLNLLSLISFSKMWRG